MENFRFAVEDVYFIGGIGTIVVGTVLCGQIDFNNAVQTLRLERTQAAIKTKKDIYMFQGQGASKFQAGDNTAILVDVSGKDIREGDILSC